MFSFSIFWYQCGFPQPPQQKAKVYAFALLSPLFVLTDRLIRFFYNFQCIRIESTIMKFTKLANHRIRHKLLVALIIKLLLLPNLIWTHCYTRWDSRKRVPWLVHVLSGIWTIQEEEPRFFRQILWQWNVTCLLSAGYCCLMLMDCDCEFTVSTSKGNLVLFFVC